jgi:O-antigen ligase
MKLGSAMQAGPRPSQAAWRVMGVGIIALALVAFITLASLRAVQGASIGSKTYVGEAVIIAIFPLLVYLAVVRPFIFPFGLFILLAPLDPLLSISSSIGTVTKLVGLCCALAFLLRLVRSRNYGKPDPAVLGLWLGFLMWMTLSVFWAIDPVTGAKRLITYVLLLALYATISLAPITALEFRWVLITIVMSGLVGAAGCWYLYHSGNHIITTTVQGVAMSRLQLELNQQDKLDPNSFAAALLLPMSIVLTWALGRSWSFMKLLYIVMFLVMVGGVYLLASRGAELALGVMILYMIVRSRYRGQLIFVAIVALASSFLLPTSPFARFSNALQSGGSGRLSIWKVGLEAFKHHWLLGAGVGNFLQAYNESFISVYQRVYASWHRAPHNFIVQVAVEFGVIGLALFLAAWYTQWRSLSVIVRSSRYFDLRIGLEAALVGLFVAGMFGNLLEQKITWLAFAVAAMARSFVLTQAAEERRIWLTPSAMDAQLPHLGGPDLKEPTRA